MKQHERIPLHDHRNRNSGGPIASAISQVISAIGGGSSSGGGSIPAGTYELAIEGGQSVIKAHGSMGSTETFDPTDGNVHTGTLTADCTFTLNAPAGSGAATLELVLTQDGTGGWTIAWPGSVTVSGTLDTTASTVSRVVLETLDGGTSWVAFVVGGSSSIADITDLPTAETDTTKRLAPDGLGGVEWAPGGSPGGQYRAWLFSASGGTLTILTAVDGTPLTGLMDLE